MFLKAIFEFCTFLNFLREELSELSKVLFFEVTVDTRNISKLLSRSKRFAHWQKFFSSNILVYKSNCLIRGSFSLKLLGQNFRIFLQLSSLRQFD